MTILAISFEIICLM